MDMQPSSSTPTTSAPASLPPVMTGRGGAKPSSWLMKLVMGIVVLLLLAAAAYGGYYWEHMRATTTESDLRGKIHQLEQQSAAGPSNGTAVNTGLAACAANDLTVAEDGTNGAAGTLGVTYVFTNKSAKSCTLTGSPTVTLADSKGAQLGDAASPSAVGDATLTLQAAGKAYATVLFPDAGNFAAGKCSAEAAMIKFVPSDGSSALQTAISGQRNCPGFAVQPFTATAP